MSIEIDWMGGRPPKNWRTYKLKHVLKEEPKELGGDYPAGSISFGEVVFKQFDNDETLATYRAVRRGQFLINPLNLNYDLKSLRIGRSAIDCRVSPAYIVTSHNATLADPHYLRWALRIFDIQHIKTLGAGVRQTVKFEDIGACPIALPNLSEQAEIAAHLDRETTRIDGLVAKKARFIALLRDKRQALITHAVTKGLDTNAVLVRQAGEWAPYPFDESRAEWSKERPEHWKSTRLRFLCRLNPLDPGTDAPSEATFLPMEAIGETGTVDTSRVIEMSVAGTSYSFFADGDVAVAKVTPCFENGKGAALTELRNGIALGSSELANLRPLRGVDQEFLYYITAADTFRQGGAATMTGAGGLKRVSNSFFKDLRLAVPTLEEQRAIVAKIKAQCSKVDALIQKTERSIELLKEHRIALITAAVTGKIDLKEVA